MDLELQPLYNFVTSLIPKIESTTSLCCPVYTDLFEYPDRYEIVIDLPGCLKNDIKLTTTGETLSVSFERQNMVRDGNPKIRCRELIYGKYERSYTLPRADFKNTKTKFENGVLSITVYRKDLEKSEIIL